MFDRSSKLVEWSCSASNFNSAALVSRFAARLCNCTFSAPSILLALWFAPSSITNPNTTTNHQNPPQTSIASSCLSHHSKQSAHLLLSPRNIEHRLSQFQIRFHLILSNCASFMDISRPSPSTPQTTIQDPKSAILSHVSDEAEWKNKNVSILTEHQEREERRYRRTIGALYVLLGLLFIKFVILLVLLIMDCCTPKADDKLQ